MPILLSPADVDLYAELTGRLVVAAARVDAIGSAVSRLLASTAWTGVSASAAGAEAQRVGAWLTRDADLLHNLAGSATRILNDLAAELARRRAIEATVRNDLGRLAALPGDLEFRARSDIEELLAHHGLPAGNDLGHLRRLLPASGHELWNALRSRLDGWLP